ncbi:hypothetical protein AB0B94_30560 [Micromonospora sp. NPDC048986]|uniref:hypothetical protein n=1 Tax=Micromonospora sp. NPDC048986 TaxID=3155644 RepID=UPI0033ECFB34
MTGTARRCSYLACPARYDAVAIETGGESAKGWRRWNSLGMRMCPDHAPLWRAGDDLGPHMPTLDMSAPTPVIRCACGWEQDTTGLSGGKAAEAYLVHLVLVELACRVRPEGAEVRGREYASEHEFGEPQGVRRFETETNRRLSEQRVAHWVGAGIPSRLVERLVWVGPWQEAT